MACAKRALRSIRLGEACDGVMLRGFDIAGNEVPADGEHRIIAAPFVRCQCSEKMKANLVKKDSVSPRALTDTVTV